MITDTTARARWSHVRLRQTKHLRDLVASFTVDQLIQPVFVVEGMAGAQPIAGLGANARLSETGSLDVIACVQERRRYAGVFRETAQGR